jgi:hypothetical protein
MSGAGAAPRVGHVPWLEWVSVSSGGEMWTWWASPGLLLEDAGQAVGAKGRIARRTGMSIRPSGVGVHMPFGYIPYGRMADARARARWYNYRATPGQHGTLFMGLMEGPHGRWRIRGTWAASVPLGDHVGDVIRTNDRAHKYAMWLSEIWLPGRCEPDTATIHLPPTGRCAPVYVRSSQHSQSCAASLCSLVSHY